MYLFNLLYLKTHYFSVQTRIIVTLYTLLYSITNNVLYLEILELFYFSLVFTLVGQLYMDVKKMITNKPFNPDDTYGYIMKIGLSYYCTYYLNLKPSYIGIVCSYFYVTL